MDKKSRSAKIVGTAKKAVGAMKAAVEKIPAKAVRKAAAQQPKIDEKFWRLVEHRAYEIYVSRGAGHGDDQRDWYEAEQWVRKDLGF